MTDKLFEVHIREILKGDKHGLSEIYTEYNPMIYSVVYEILRNRQNAEDVTSEFFIKLWKIAPTYRFGGRHKAWLITIAHNMAIDYVRKNSPLQSAEVIDEDLEIPVSASDDEILTRLTLQQALKTLEEEERQIVNFKIMGGLTFREIAHILARPLGTVTWKYNRAMNKLRRYRYE